MDGEKIKCKELNFTIGTTNSKINRKVPHMRHFHSPIIIKIKELAVVTGDHCFLEFYQENYTYEPDILTKQQFTTHASFFSKNRQDDPPITP